MVGIHGDVPYSSPSFHDHFGEIPVFTASSVHGSSAFFRPKAFSAQQPLVSGRREQRLGCDCGSFELWEIPSIYAIYVCVYVKYIIYMYIYIILLHKYIR